MDSRVLKRMGWGTISALGMDGAGASVSLSPAHPAWQETTQVNAGLCSSSATVPLTHCHSLRERRGGTSFYLGAAGKASQGRGTSGGS